MCVPCNEQFIIKRKPFVVISLDFMTLVRIFCRTGWIVKTDHMKIAPEMTVEEFHDWPNLIIDKVTLVAVNDKDFAVTFNMMKNDPFVYFNIGEQAIGK